MKARVKATGEIVEVHKSAGVLDENSERIYPWYEVETLDSRSDDYWTRLEHQYAGMAMQGILSNPRIMETLGCKNDHERLIETTISIATALVEKLKEDSYD